MDETARVLRNGYGCCSTPALLSGSPSIRERNPVIEGAIDKVPASPESEFSQIPFQSIHERLHPEPSFHLDLKAPRSPTVSWPYDRRAI
jgi:hypothetical protein